MDREELCSKIGEVLEQMMFQGKRISCTKYGNGHINDTYLVICDLENQKKKYILQRMNQQIFAEPEKLMLNICGVTNFLRAKIAKEGGDKERETLQIIMTKDNKPYYKDSIGSYWRAYDLIEGATCFEQADKPDIFYQSAVAFGRFQSLLSDYDAKTLYDVIPDFHNTPVRFEKFMKVVKQDCCNRRRFVEKEIQFLMDREKDMSVTLDLLKEGKLPLRVTHNDTKLNNVLIDDKTGKGLCVIDLDTVMPGLSINDFGDSIRFGASTATEDETDLSKVSMDLDLFEAYTKGFLEGCGGSLTEKELEMLPMGAKMMTIENGMRFLTDYLEGDVYFKIHRPEQNLDRSRTQLKLVADMENKMDQMHAIVSKIQKGYN